MSSERNASIPIWERDELDSPAPPVNESAYFDAALDAWVLSRYSDVFEALRSENLVMDSTTPPASEETRAMKKMRQETIEALSFTQLHIWGDTIAPFIEMTLASLREDLVIDLLEAYLLPICLELAAMVTEVDRTDAPRLRELARPISAAAAEPADNLLRERARAATPAFQACFHARAESLRDSGFVALSHTLPCLLANGCYALLRHPEQWAVLHQQPDLMEEAVEELMRYGGLCRYLRRRATVDINLAGVKIRKHERLILRIIAANRDAERFASPNDLQVLRRAAGHLTLGAGPHACVGASLLRMAFAAALRPLARRFASVQLGGQVEWQGGSGFRAPRYLPVIFREAAAAQDT